VNGYQVQEKVLSTKDRFLAAVLMVFGAKPREAAPLLWVDYHENRERFVRYLEEMHKRDKGEAFSIEFNPTTVVTLFFEGVSIPAAEIIAAYHCAFEKVDKYFEDSIKDLPENIQRNIRDTVSWMIARSCHQALDHYDFLVSQIKRTPEWAKWDEVNTGKKSVRMGKRSSPQLRAELLDKI
jgi:hypothetical protein